jgi:hypothetical protein
MRGRINQKLVQKSVARKKLQKILTQLKKTLKSNLIAGECSKRVTNNSMSSVLVKKTEEVHWRGKRKSFSTAKLSQLKTMEMIKQMIMMRKIEA